MLFSLSTVAYAFTNNTEEGKSSKELKHMIVFNQSVSKTDLVDFAQKYNLSVKSVTFQGNNFSCGGTINSIVEIDLLIKRLIENWEDDLTQEKIPDKNKDKIKERIELAKGNHLKAVSIEVIGDIPEGLNKDKIVKQTLIKNIQ